MSTQIELKALVLLKGDLAAAKGAPVGRVSDLPNTCTCIGGHGKRAIDIIVATLALIVLAVPMLMVAVLIRLTMGGPVIFRHVRVGLGGALFECLKFRTMISDSDAALARHLAENPEAALEWQKTRKLKKDPRVTWLGRALRTSSLDELPQLFNILKGEMSCVGPRPIVADELALYEQEAEKYLQVRPGLTGLWQVSGRSELSYGDRVALDAAYVSNWSMWGDLVIIARTAPALLKSHQTS
ncbi:MAG TPA: sugar transferase [Ancylobacter sp.]